MKQMNELETGELLDVSCRALELGARRFKAIAAAADPSDLALREVLQRMSQDADEQVATIKELETRQPTNGEFRPSALEQGSQLIGQYLTSLKKSFGEGPLHRDIALFLAESLEEETSRLCRVLAEHAKDWKVVTLFSDLATREQGNFRYLREVVLQ